MMPAPAHAEKQNVISLAEHRQRVFPVDTGPPPPAPCPAAARRPATMLFIDAIGCPSTSLNTIKAAPASFDTTHENDSFRNAA